jgi:probable lipoprotein NlpC
MKPKRAALSMIAFAALADLSFAEAPVFVAVPKEARSRIVDAALSYEGSPYLLGGTDASGFDCSGLVYRVFLQAIGARLPRTAREQFDFGEPIAMSKLQPGDLLFFNTTSPIAHVGIYEGDGRFVHAASDGPDLGVIESSLSESYWAKAFAEAGRIIPPAEYLGLILSASLGPGFGAEEAFRGIRGSFGVAYRLLGIEAGIELRPEYDRALGDFRLPAVLAIGIDKRLEIYAGPALTIGSPNLEGTRAYEASGGLIATVGIDYTLFLFRLSAFDFGLRGGVAYDSYVPAQGLAADSGKDFAAAFSADLGLSVGYGL